MNFCETTDLSTILAVVHTFIFAFYILFALILAQLHSEQPKLHSVLAILSAIGLNLLFTQSNLSGPLDTLVTPRQAT